MCHGAPGVSHLMLLSHRVWGHETDTYMTAARKAGDLVWERGLLKKGPGLCHGVAGNGYTFLHLYQVLTTTLDSVMSHDTVVQVTGEDVWLYRAAMFGQWLTELVRQDQNIPDRPLSLFEGIAGAVHYLHDLTQDPKKAKFPCLMI